MDGPVSDVKEHDDARPKRDAAGRFVPGSSGNRAGRPVGSGVIAALREKLATNMEPVIGRLYDQALKGDSQAASLLLARVFPSLRPVDQPVSFSLPDGTQSDAARAVLRAVADGTLTPGQAGEILSAMAAAAKVVEVDELAKRVQALEGGS